MDRTLDSVGNGYRLCILGYLNGWIGDKTRAGITGAFEAAGKNDNGRRVVEFCEEREVYVGNIYFKNRSVHKYTRGAGGRDDVEIKNMIDLVLVKRDMLAYAAIYAGCEGSERDGTRHLRPLCCTV